MCHFRLLHFIQLWDLFPSTSPYFTQLILKLFKLFAQGDIILWSFNHLSLNSTFRSTRLRILPLTYCLFCEWNVIEMVQAHFRAFNVLNIKNTQQIRLCYQQNIHSQRHILPLTNYQVHNGYLGHELQRTSLSRG